MARPEQIKDEFLTLIDRHLDDLVHLRVTEMMEIKDFAETLHIHPTHLSNTIKELCGTSPCGLYQPKILRVAQELLADTNFSIHETALRLSFEPSQFTKWFKQLTGITPKAYRTQILK
ncbi:helix-turn-helix transcriptional regulator [Pedobacter sp. L105]|uniref:helix-turn-helix transcriptional regulator n=1 Tax=Pedobacter sp. L105 TaxID=1641871 RepID=UPI00131C29AF|nr:helix-turn-helix transcriptional regulator [Pedobacter sp. L105]